MKTVLISLAAALGGAAGYLPIQIMAAESLGLQVVSVLFAGVLFAMLVVLAIASDVSESRS